MGRKPVSYTHLDVYKRQADYRLPNYQPNDLPSTGHGGNTIAYVIGGILLMLGGFGMYRYRTRREGG